MNETKELVVEGNPYSHLLSGFYQDKTIDWLTTRHYSRIQQLHKYSVKPSSIILFLKVIRDNMDKDIEIPLEMREFISPSNVTIKHRNRKQFFDYSGSSFPFCCGIYEYGDFVFDIQNFGKDCLLVYNLIIDYLRLNSYYNQEDYTGAYSMINYFIDTKFTAILE